MRIAKFLSKDKLRLIINAFVKSQFSYCSLIWMFHNRTLNNKINRLHERALRLVHKNYNGTFQDLLNLENGFSVHEKNLQKLATEMFKVKNKLSPILVQDLFKEHRMLYNLRNEKLWESDNIKTDIYGLETVSYRGPKIWDTLPENIKHLPHWKNLK